MTFKILIFILLMFGLTALRVFVEIKLAKLEQEKYKKKVLNNEKNRNVNTKPMDVNVSNQCNNNQACC